jgi:2-aminoethylphosphonate-pyruvate transaminase
MPTETDDPWLLTPGPLTTSLSIKEAMLHDWGSRDDAVIAKSSLP